MRKPRPAIGFVMDHPQRDLPGAVTVAHALTARGADAYVIPMYDQATDVPLLPLDALVVNFARPANLDLVQGYCDAGLPVFVMDTEGGTLTETGTNTPQRMAAALAERGFSDLLAGYFFWGPALHSAYVAHSGMPSDSLVVTGCPRFDYASPRWRAALTYPYKEFVLINASYPMVNPRFVRSDVQERATAVAAGWDAAYLERLVEDMREVFRGFKETVHRLAHDSPRTHFVVRPHPFEDATTYEREFHDLGNVTVSGRGSVLNAIARARCLVHLNCTTAVEATMLERLPVSIEYLNTPRLRGHAPLPSRISAQPRDYADLREIVHAPDAYARTFPFVDHYRSAIFPWFFENDGRAADRVAETLLARVPARRGRASIARSLAASRRTPRLGQRLQSVAANAFGSLVTSRLRSGAQAARREKLFSPRDIAIELEGLCQLERRPVPQVSRARHPLTRAPLASVICRPT